nr:unnamed protein product [Callosobruchus analis]
MFGIKKHSV